MEPLTPADVKRWDTGAIHSVFETARGRVATLQRLGDSLGQVGSVLADWHGEAGEAFHDEVGKVRRDVDADGAESARVAAAVSRAEADVRACKAELEGIERTAEDHGWTITVDWRIDVGNTGIGIDPVSFAAEQQVLQDALDACKVHAHSADHELAAAIRDAVGDDARGGPGPPGAPKPVPNGPPRSLEDMLVPAGAAGAGPDDGPPSPGGFAGKPPSLEDMLLGRTLPAGTGEPQPGDLPDLLSRFGQPVAGIPGPQLKPADVEAFKAMARKSMVADGVPPDQIDAQLDAAVARTQQWLDNGMPDYVAPEPPRQPPPGFAEGFGNRWFAFEQQIKDLTGQEGVRALGDSWGGMAEGLVGKTGEYATQGPVAAVNDLTREFQNVVAAPSLAYYAGEKAADGAIALPGLLFGGEGAGLGELTDVAPGAVYDGLKPLPHSPISLDNPTNYHTWGPPAAQDLFSALVHGEPTTGLSRQVADFTTHYIGDNPDRVVLGKWDGQDGGYIGEARAHGGIFFDTGDPTWDAMTYGLSESDKTAMTWQVNEQFLRSQMEDHVPRIEHILDQDKYPSLEAMALERAGSFSAMEVEFLSTNAAAFGYERAGDSWIYVGRR